MPAIALHTYPIQFPMRSAFMTILRKWMWSAMQGRDRAATRHSNGFKQLLHHAGPSSEYKQWLRSRPSDSSGERHHGTTGALALDQKGNLAAGTTTGGTPWKLPGRVGDSPLIGAGTYANNTLGCAVSGSGAGEYFIRNAIAADVCHRAVYLHQGVEQAAEYVINTELKEQRGEGGVIVLNSDGHFVRVFNTAAFWVGYIDANGNRWLSYFDDVETVN